ncbi:putative PH-like domain superfamily, NECAP, PHear domain-containing protein [Helianthus anomalus]
MPKLGPFSPRAIAAIGASSSNPRTSCDGELEEEEDSFEHTLLVVREVSVFKIPPRSTSGGYMCGEWLQSDKIWSGRLRVISCNNRCEIRLEDPNSGDLFAAGFVNPGQRETAVEPVLDSSRYFVLKIEDGTEKHAFIGLGITAVFTEERD